VPAIMIHPATELRFVNEQVGYGVVATALIPRGAITWVKDDLDQTFTPAEIQAMAPPYRQILDKYTYVDESGLHVLCWDIARFVNHSCDPTCRAPGYDLEVAVRDIQPGQELTDDYGSLNIGPGFTVCRCGSPRCRRQIAPDDLVRYAQEWDAELRAVLPSIEKVDQPLWFFVQEKAQLEDVFAGRAPMASCLESYYERRPPRARGLTRRRAGR
jgi:hypothetical protein